MTRSVYLLQITEGERQTLYKRRELMLELQEAQERLQEAQKHVPGACSPKFDGMPKGAGGKDQIHATVAERDRLRNKVAALRSRANGLLRPCLRITDKLPPRLYRFSRLYYVDGKSITETAKELDRTRRCCEMYRAEIEYREDR